MRNKDQNVVQTIMYRLPFSLIENLALYAHAWESSRDDRSGGLSIMELSKHARIRMQQRGIPARHGRAPLPACCAPLKCNLREILMKMFRIYVAALLALFASLISADEYLGQLSENPYNLDSTSNEFGQYGSPYSSESINNPYGPYGSRFSNDSATNPHATNAPNLYDGDGNYRGKLSSNPYDPDSVSNPYGRYGNPYSSDSINNPYGAGNPYRSDSPTNPYGEGLSIFSDDDG
jgi:hypothetical protein